MKHQILLIGLCFSFNAWGGVYKCVDATGHSYYQSSPCTESDKAVQINTKTGSKVDLNELENQKTQEAEQKKQLQAEQQAEEQARLETVAQRRQQTQAQNELTQALIKQNPMQFSAYAIPPYDPDKLPKWFKPFEQRLPDIEKFRRLAAQKALATGQCKRVETDELSPKSTAESLVFMINCSSGSSYYINELELGE